MATVVNNNHRLTQLKNAIYSLYVVKGHKLEGSDGVMKLMEDRHGFKASKTQYQRYLKEWGFQKNRKGDDYKVLALKIKSRKRKAGKDSDVYDQGKLIPRKKLKKDISGQGYMTFAEEHQRSQGSPKTPPGIQIRTPPASGNSLNRLVFENLPIFQFQESIGPALLESSKNALNPEVDTISVVLQSAAYTDSLGGFLRTAGSLLPNNALLEEPLASEIAVRPEKVSGAELLNFLIFETSNNFPGEADGATVYEWLKSYGTADVIKVLAGTRCITAKATLESVFRLAVEAGDVQTVKLLLKTGMNPNRYDCLSEDIADTFSPLQLACITGNLEMAQALVDAGSMLDEHKGTWKRSILVLTIFGAYHHNESIETAKTYEIPLYNLVSRMINHGAKVNFEESLELSHEDLCNPTIRECFLSDHSPLTAASRCLFAKIVGLLIERGADVNHLTLHGSTATQECLYTSEEITSKLEEITNRAENVSRPRRLKLPPRRQLLSRDRILEKNILRRLLEAGADPNQSTFYKFESGKSPVILSGECGKRLSVLDMAVYTESIGIIELLLSRGSSITKATIEIASGAKRPEILDRLLQENSCVSRGLILNRTWRPSNNKEKVKRPPGNRLQKASLINALNRGDINLLDRLLKRDNSISLPCFEESEDLRFAIEKCCVRGDSQVLGRILDSGLKHQSVFTQSLPYHLFNTIMHSTNPEPIVHLILGAGVDVNIPANSHEETPLLAAVWRGNLSVVRTLLNAGASFKTKKNRCERIEHISFSGSLLIIALEKGDDEIVQELIDAGADLEAPGSAQTWEDGHLFFGCGCKTPLTAAVEKMKWNWITEFIFSRCVAVSNPPELTGRQSPLSEATKHGDIHLVKLLLHLGANPEDVEALRCLWIRGELREDFLTALKNRRVDQNCGMLGLDALKGTINECDTELFIAILGSRFVDLNSIEEGQSILAIALQDNIPNLKIISHILKSGADPNGIIREDTHNILSALQLCADLPPRPGEQPTRFLLEAGAHPNQALIPGMRGTALQYSVNRENLELSKLLLEKGAIPNIASPFGEMGSPIQIAVENQHLESIQLLLEYKANPDAIGGGEMHTALQMACRDGEKEIVQLLLEHGADVNKSAARDSGATALQFAAIGGYLGIAYILWEHGADANAPRARINGRTALEGAAEHGRLEMIQFLLNAGAEVGGSGLEEYERALDFASRNGHYAIWELLKSHGGNAGEDEQNI